MMKFEPSFRNVSGRRTEASSLPLRSNWNDTYVLPCMKRKISERLNWGIDGWHDSVTQFDPALESRGLFEL
ncbi:hypothetical protein [Bifidobacterium choloepi]|uniref:hypothetical protein n=1 Tax=Bifidobacterium choloepi TaxID=2614131 RepID=UPI0013D547ED|nr:hypothetical protein [Bifidobacterium choloepi]